MFKFVHAIDWNQEQKKEASYQLTHIRLPIIALGPVRELLSETLVLKKQYLSLIQRSFTVFHDSDSDRRERDGCELIDIV